MDYRFTALLIVLLCLLTFCLSPKVPTPLKIDSKEYIIPLKKPGAGIDNAGWDKIK